jgi:peptidoglycan/LPS O-acetylase OafA/YrhL
MIERPPILKEYLSIQILRALAAMLVVLMHLQVFYGDSMKYLGGREPYMSRFFYFKVFGGCGVQIFFVISGFIMAFLKEKGESSNLADFILRRLTRIVPLYWIVTLFWTFFLAGFSNISTSRLLHSLFFIPEADNMTVVGPGWSLNFEMLFYLIFGILTFILRCSYIWIGIFFLLLHLCGEVLGYPVMVLLGDPIVWNFIAGIAIFYLHQNPSIQRESTIISVVGASILISTIFWHIPDKSFGIRQFMPWGIPSMLIVLGAVSMEAAGKGTRIFKNSVLLVMGNASYSLYLIHTLCFFGVSTLLLYKLKLQTIVGPDGALIIYFVVCCGIALIVHNFIEKPSTRLIRWLIARVGENKPIAVAFSPKKLN